MWTNESRYCCSVFCYFVEFCFPWRKAEEKWRLKPTALQSIRLTVIEKKNKQLFPEVMSVGIPAIQNVFISSPNNTVSQWSLFDLYFWAQCKFACLWSYFRRDLQDIFRHSLICLCIISYDMATRLFIICLVGIICFDTHFFNDLNMWPSASSFKVEICYFYHTISISLALNILKFWKIQ